RAERTREDVRSGPRHPHAGTPPAAQRAEGEEAWVRPAEETTRNAGELPPWILDRDRAADAHADRRRVPPVPDKAGDTPRNESGRTFARAQCRNPLARLAEFGQRRRRARRLARWTRADRRRRRVVRRLGLFVVRWHAGQRAARVFRRRQVSWRRAWLSAA